MSPTCQHIFCSHCLTRAVLLSPSCPIDRSPLTLEEIVAAPRIVQQMVRELKVLCPNRASGCEHECERGLLAGHLKDQCRETMEERRRRDSGKGKEAVSEEAATNDADAIVRCKECEEQVKESLLHVCPLCLAHLLLLQMPRSRLISLFQ